MGKELKILISNDDGINAEGIKLLARVASKICRVYVVAPQSQCSAMSQRITLRQKMLVTKVEDFPVPVECAYSVDGTPADCVKVAINYIMDEKPDVVFSGMNIGLNAGYDIAYSGTVGAAMEALMNHIPAIAFSNQANKGVCDSWEVAEAYGEEIARKLLGMEINNNEIWNVNFPSCSTEELQGIKWDVPVAPVQVFNDNIVEYRENGNIYVAEEGVKLPLEAIPAQTDCWSIFHNYISVGKVRCLVL